MSESALLPGYRAAASGLRNMTDLTTHTRPKESNLWGCTHPNIFKCFSPSLENLQRSFSFKIAYMYFWGNWISMKYVHGFRKTRASRTTGAKGSNSFARNNRPQITNDHMERIRLQVSANNK